MASIVEMRKKTGSARVHSCWTIQPSSTSKRDWRVGLTVLATAITATMLSAAPALSAQASKADGVTACVSPIANCGCTITKPGFYTLANDLTSTQGLTADNGCIDIKASQVVLNTGKPVVSGHTNSGYDLTGPGGAPPADIGIHVLKGSKNDFLELPSDIDGWDVGILIEGDNVVAEDFDSEFNGTAGVEISGGKNNNVNDFTVDDNLNYGVWLRGASDNQINCSDTDDNGNIGVYVGCSAEGPIDGKCSPKVAPSSGNHIYDHSSNNNTNYGVVIDLGNGGNTVSDLDGDSNGVTDLLDENASCGSDLWFFDSYGTASPSCIQ